MTEKAGTQEKQLRKTLWIVLGVLLAIMVVLIIVLVVVKQQGCQNLEGQTQEQQQTSQENWEEQAEEGEVFAGGPEVEEGMAQPGGGDAEYGPALEQWAKDSETVEELNTQIIPMSVEQAEEFLDGKLKEYAGTDMEYRIEVMKIWVYNNEGQYQNALGLAQKIDPDQLSELQKVDYYRVMWVINEGLGNNTQASQYENKWQELHNKLFSAGENLE